MSSTQSPILSLAATAFATIMVGFGVNALVRPAHALSFFEFEPPAGAADRQMVDSLMAVYGVRDIFMGLAMYIALLFGTPKSLGWTLIITSLVAFADGAICWTHGQGQWAHWSYAPMILIVGGLTLRTSAPRAT
ncbi:hypothetical protein N7456_011436 [Penicillium angulare]|uniref:Uncharacterized protein n=1 Tax=Penicillium angulare TaxID=116970 RepID=A0A9W9EU07_9EURO|nr:hypothetical protein N7456_011436 [Penicillium angulare]